MIKLSDNVEAAGQFIGGIAPFRVNDKFGFVDRSGKVICQPIFEDVVFDNIFY